MTLLVFYKNNNSLHIIDVFDNKEFQNLFYRKKAVGNPSAFSTSQRLLTHLITALSF